MTRQRTSEALPPINPADEAIVDALVAKATYGDVVEAGYAFRLERLDDGDGSITFRVTPMPTGSAGGKGQGHE